MAFDKKRFGNHEAGSKTIESIEDILFINTCRYKCGGTPCGDCGMKLYTTSCVSVDSIVVDWLNEEIGADNDFFERITKGKKGLDAQEEAYRAIFEDPLWMPPKKPTFGANEEAGRCEGTCSGCRYSQMHTSGILFCKSFGNLVHEDGFCYRYESDKIEEQP